MTNEEAIKYLQQLYPNGGHCWLDEQRIEAIGMAIYALQEEPVSKDLVEEIDNYVKRKGELRTIKFRAKDLQGKWLYGDLRHHKNDTCIFEAGGTKGEQIDQQTIGMGTGVLDKEGTEIFEGDVVQNGEGGYFYVVYWWDEDAAFRGKQVGSSSTIGLNYWRKELRIVGNMHDDPELLQYKPAPPKRRDHHTLLYGEFRIKGTCSNGCMCQPDVIYVARWLTKADGRGKAGRLRIWAHGSWVEDGKRYGSYCDWKKSILQNYEVLPDQMSREAYEKWQ